ncbi:hypothetical protein ACFWBI_08950 [Streptomyces sp. NPDC059982]
MTEPREPNPGAGNPYANLPEPAPPTDEHNVVTVGAIDDYQPGEQP